MDTCEWTKAIYHGFFKSKTQKKLMAIFILFEQCILRGLNLRNYLKVNKIGSQKEYYS